MIHRSQKELSIESLRNFAMPLALTQGSHLSKTKSRTISGFGRNDRFSYIQRFGGPGEVANRVLVEAGAASGREPTVMVELQSYAGQFLQDRALSLGAEDEGPFPFRLLHFRRTFVEKMFAIHSKVELLKRDGQPLGTYARHYYDLFQLAAEQQVTAMLKSSEYAAIKGLRPNQPHPFSQIPAVEQGDLVGRRDGLAGILRQDWQRQNQDSNGAHTISFLKQSLSTTD